MILDVAFSKDGKWLAVIDLGRSVYVYDRRHPEYWYGVAWLPEFWLTLVLGGALVSA